MRILTLPTKVELADKTTKIRQLNKTYLQEMHSKVIDMK